MRTRTGFTLIETVVALVVFTLVVISGTTMLLYAGETSEKISLKNELLENARITLDFIIEQIRTSEGYTLQTDINDSLIRLVCYKELYDSGSNFDFNKNLSSDSPRYGQVVFAGNELSSYIADVKIRVDENKMEVQVITWESISENSNIQVTPITITGKVSLQYIRNVL